MTNVYTAARLRKGLPVPMKCTYNGMAVINAAPFRLHNLRFRWESLLGGPLQLQREGLPGLRLCWDTLWPGPPRLVPGELQISPVLLLWSHILHLRCTSLQVTTCGGPPSFSLACFI